MIEKIKKLIDVKLDNINTVALGIVTQYFALLFFALLKISIVVTKPCNEFFTRFLER